MQQGLPKPLSTSAPAARHTVPSSRSRRMLEIEVIMLLDQQVIVICAGGDGDRHGPRQRPSGARCF